ncbi:MAG: hypothetical protein WC789_04735 [Lentisphaeria bacterium]|jgi:hypothetical protein
MKQRLLIIVSILALVAALFLIRPMYEIGVFVYYSLRLSKAAEFKISSLTSERVQKLIVDAERLAAQSHTQDELLFSSDGSVPKEFSDLAPTWVSILPDQVMIEFMGGFDHRGIVMRKDTSGSWLAFRYNEATEKPLK